MDIDGANLAIRVNLNRTVSVTTINLESLIETMRSSGASDKVIKEVLMNDLKNGGKIFGQFKNQFKAIGEYGIGNMANIGIVSVLSSKYEGQEYKWQAVGRNICPDCQDRHGQIATWEEWKLAGLPQSGFSVCGMHCKCTLVNEGNWNSDPLKMPLPE